MLHVIQTSVSEIYVASERIVTITETCILGNLSWTNSITYIIIWECCSYVENNKIKFKKIYLPWMYRHSCLYFKAIGLTNDISNIQYLKVLLIFPNNIIKVSSSDWICSIYTLKEIQIVFMCTIISKLFAQA